MKEIKFAVIPDENGNTEGENGYRLYYVAGDPDGRYILNSNAGVVCSNFSFLDAFGGIEGAEEIEREIEATIKADSGEAIHDEESIPSEAAEIMRQWGWLA